MEPQKWFPWRGTTPVQITEMGSLKSLSFKDMRWSEFLWRGNFRDKSQKCSGPGISDFPKLSVTALFWPRGSTGVQRYGCIPRSAANNLGEIPQNLGALNPLFWRVFGGEGTHWDVSLLVSLTLWDTPVLFTPPLPPPPTVLVGQRVGDCWGHPMNSASCATAIQRRRNDDKNHFWEVESKGGSAGGPKRGSTGDPSWNFIVGLKHRKKQHFGKSHFYCRRFFPGNAVTIILDNYPPSTLQGVGLGGRKNPRMIVGENYCHFAAPPSNTCRGDQTWNMSGTNELLHSKQGRNEIVFQPLRTVASEVITPKCCYRKQFRQHPLQNPPPLRTPKTKKAHNIGQTSILQKY